MMKIGILTFIHTRNFGANLQCFALQHKLNLMGFDAEVINFYRPIDRGYIVNENDNKRFPAIFRHRSIKDYRSKINKFVVSLFRRLVAKQQKTIKQTDGFLSFHQQYIRFSTEEYRNITQLYEHFPRDKYSHLIVGSDQVWNYDAPYSKEPFFLTFAHQAKKISYAASLGHTKLPPRVEQLYRGWLQDFSVISVREDTAQKAISSITEKPVYQVLDPTLLLNKEEWLKSLAVENHINGDYVLVYMLSVSRPAIEMAQVVARKFSCCIKIITNRPLLLKDSNCEILRNESPKSFLEKYSEAKFVVTNSFHGTAFAINFNIPFVTIEKKGGRLNSRKASLLKLLNLSERCITEGDSYDLDKIIHCDFSLANRVLEEEREKSVMFLTSSLAYD